MARMPTAPPAGVVRNATPSATPGRWWDANNVRFRQGMLQPIGGNVAIPNTGTSDRARDLLTYHDNNKIRWAIFGTDTKLYAYRFDLEEPPIDITPAGVGPLDPPGARVGWGLADYGESTYGTARDPSDIGPQDIAASQGDRWSLDTFGEQVLVVPTQDGKLYVWDPNTPSAPAALITEAPEQNRGVLVTDQRHVVLLGSGGNPRRIAWSDQENYRVWTADVTNLAGGKELQTQSYAMTAIKVSGTVLIFTANDVHSMNYVGPPYGYGITGLAAGCGPISLRSVVAIGSFVAWPGLNTFWTYGGTVTPLPCDVQDWFFSLVNRESLGRVFGSPNPTFSELWWDWPDEGAAECNRYLILNYSDPKHPWSIGMRSRTAADPSGTMDFPVLAGDDGNNLGHGCLYLHEYGMTENGRPRGANGQIFAESGAIAIGEGDKRMHVKQLVFDAASDTGPGLPVLGYRFLFREQPQADETDSGLYTSIHDGLMDLRFSCRTARMRMEALGDEQFAVGRPQLEVRPGGRR